MVPNANPASADLGAYFLGLGVAVRVTSAEQQVDAPQRQMRFFTLTARGGGVASRWWWARKRHERDAHSGHRQPGSGIRRALGAKRGVIRGQFLIEAVTLSLLGGLAGIAIGVAVPSASACPRAGPSPSAMALGFQVASTVGVFFGAYVASAAGARADFAETTMGDFIEAGRSSRSSSSTVFYRTTGGLYWKVFTDFAPRFTVNGATGRSSRETTFVLRLSKHRRPALATLSSNLFWWWYTVTSNLRDLNPIDWQLFPVPRTALDDTRMASLGARYIADLKRNSEMLVRHQKSTGRTETQSFEIAKSKPIIDEIDAALAPHYGLDDEELDFIINYDIKWRMSSQA